MKHRAGTLLFGFFFLFASCRVADPVSPGNGPSPSVSSASAGSTAGSGPSSATRSFVFEEEDFRVYSGVITQSAEDYLRLEESKMTRSFALSDQTAFANLPPKADLSATLPPAGFQGKQNSCTGWTVAYAVKSFQENRELGWGYSQAKLFSPSFIYNQVNEGKDEGADLKDVMDFVVKHGTVPLALMPYDEEDFQKPPSEAAKRLALGFRALGYRRINEKDVMLVKSYLAAGEPVMIVTEVFETFLKRGMRNSGGIYKEAKGKNHGHHSLVAVGYDDAKHAVMVLNSWGKEWGEGGYGWIDYNFFPRVTLRAYILYDTPTPSVTVAVLTGAAPDGLLAIDGMDTAITVAYSSKNLDDPAVPKNPDVGKLIAGGSGEDEPLLIVPNEGGITLKGQWLRLAEPLTRAREFFSPATSKRFTGFNHDSDDIHVAGSALSQEAIAKLAFFASDRIPVFTNQGATFGTPRADVQRMYGIADHVDLVSHSETYFFHAVKEDWGGIQVTKHAALTFTYRQDRVDYMTLESVFKKIVQGRALQDVGSDEITRGADLTTVRALDGKIVFTVPARFSKINKALWEGSGYGYFISNPANMEESLFVKVFTLTTPVTPELLSTRIAADLKQVQLSHLPSNPKTLAGITWQEVYSTETAKFLRYYGARGSDIYQVLVIADGDAKATPWIPVFLESIRIP